jgi:outer membrane immunogenic protein
VGVFNVELDFQTTVKLCEEERPLSRPIQALAIAAGVAAASLAVPGTTSAGTIFAIPSGSNSTSASSWLAGAHAGYNWQRGSAVFGFETDLSATHLNSAMSGGLSYPPSILPQPGDAAGTTGLIDWYGTLRGRLAAAAGPVMFYGTAGLAYGNVSLSSMFSGGGLLLNSQTSSLKTGWVAGAGVEYLLRPNLILSLGYQYVDLGTVNLAGTMTRFGLTIAQNASDRAQFQAVMAGLSWKFSPAGSSAPWEGGYIGGHLGGAWGNPTDAAYTSSISPIVVSDVRLKRDVTLVGRRDDGIGIYRYKYLWSDTVYVGVLAQEVALAHPEAVVRDPLNGYLGVDYGRLGLHLVALAD